MNLWDVVMMDLTCPGSVQCVIFGASSLRDESLSEEMGFFRALVILGIFGVVFCISLWCFHSVVP